MTDLKKKRVLVTGGSSMLGSHICDVLELHGADIYCPTHEQLDLMDTAATVRKFNHYKPHYVIHAAGYNGSIGFNKKYPADIYWRTVQMGLNVLRAAQEVKPQRVMSLISSCAYPVCDQYHDNLPYEEHREHTLFDGPPHESVECHGFAKRTLQEFSRQLYKQYKLDAVCVAINNCYGPRDRFDAERGKVVSALIRRFADAKATGAPSVTLRGTGSPLREFVYAPDAARAVIEILGFDGLGSDYPMNVGNGQEISIKELSETVAKAIGYDGIIFWGPPRDDGQMRKRLDSDWFRRFFPDFTWTGFADGLSQTVEWYLNHKSN